MRLVAVHMLLLNGWVHGSCSCLWTEPTDDGEHGASSRCGYISVTTSNTTTHLVHDRPFCRFHVRRHIHSHHLCARAPLLPDWSVLQYPLHRAHAPLAPERDHCTRRWWCRSDWTKGSSVRQLLAFGCRSIESLQGIAFRAVRVQMDPFTDGWTLAYWQHHCERRFILCGMWLAHMIGDYLIYHHQCLF